jgi:hypothetical protein
MADAAAGRGDLVAREGEVSRARAAPPPHPRARALAPPGVRARRLSSAGQATIETVALVPLVVAIGLAVLQLLAVGYASVLAGSAAEAGALALAAGADPRAGVHEALPGWSEARARVAVEGGLVEVRLRPPSPLRVVGERLEVTGRAAVEDP